MSHEFYSVFRLKNSVRAKLSLRCFLVAREKRGSAKWNLARVPLDTASHVVNVKTFFRRRRRKRRQRNKKVNRVSISFYAPIFSISLLFTAKNFDFLKRHINSYIQPSIYSNSNIMFEANTCQYDFHMHGASVLSFGR